MAVNRTIYPQGQLRIHGYGIVYRQLSGVQSVSFTVNSPREDVNQFGTLGAINNVQLEAPRATLEVTDVVNSFDTGILPWLIQDAKRASPYYYEILATGIGRVVSGVLTSLRVDTAVGNLPTLTLTFEGTSGNGGTPAPMPSAPNVTTVPVVTPDQITGILFSGTSSCLQNLRLTWEMPVDSYLCLGNAFSSACVVPRPPGTYSVTVDSTSYPNLVTGFNIGPHVFNLYGIQEVSRNDSLAIGEPAATYGLTEEGVGLAMGLTEADNDGVTLPPVPSSTLWVYQETQSSGQPLTVDWLTNESFPTYGWTGFKSQVRIYRCTGTGCLSTSDFSLVTTENLTSQEWVDYTAFAPNSHVRYFAVMSGDNYYYNTSLTTGNQDMGQFTNGVWNAV